MAKVALITLLILVPVYYLLPYTGIPMFLWAIWGEERQDLASMIYKLCCFLVSFVISLFIYKRFFN